jgi:rubrerythrin
MTMTNYRRTREQNEVPVFNMSGSFDRGYVRFYFKRVRSGNVFVCNIPAQMSISNMKENLAYYVEQQFQMNSFEIVHQEPRFARRFEDAPPIIINDAPVITLCSPGQKTECFYVRQVRQVRQVSETEETGQCMVCFIENIPTRRLTKNYRCADNALHYLCSGCLYHCNARPFLSNVCPLCRAECFATP